MLHKTIDILKARWPEVMLVVVLQAAMMLLVEEVTLMAEKADSQATVTPLWSGFILGMGLMLCAILWQMLYLGFLKTAAVSGNTPQQPMQLLSSGRPFFWRIFFFQILLGLVLLVVNSVIVGLLSLAIWKGRQLEQLPSWFVQLCGLAGVMILLKPMLLVPAGILVYNISAIEAFVQMRRVSLFQIDQIKLLISGGFIVIILTALLSELLQSGSSLHYVASGLHHILFSTIFLSLTLVAVLWIQQQFDVEHIEVQEVEQ